MDPERITAAVEVRSAADGPTLYGTIIQEGRAASAGRAELFAPGALVWPSDGIAIRTEHHGPAAARAVPTRQPNGEIRISARATDAIRRAVDVEGRRFMSVEFRCESDRRTPAGVREILRALVTAAALTARPEYTQTAAEVRTQAARRYFL